eukprot:12549152-Alexandrium_andersonii.AAC.1
MLRLRRRRHRTLHAALEHRALRPPVQACPVPVHTECLVRIIGRPASEVQRISQERWLWLPLRRTAPGTVRQVRHRAGWAVEKTRHTLFSQGAC